MGHFTKCKIEGHLVNQQFVERYQVVLLFRFVSSVTPQYCQLIGPFLGLPITWLYQSQALNRKLILYLKPWFLCTAGRSHVFLLKALPIPRDRQVSAKAMNSRKLFHLLALPVVQLGFTQQLVSLAKLITGSPVRVPHSEYQILSAESFQGKVPTSRI